MKLNRLERYTAYCIILSELESYKKTATPQIAHDGFCFLVFHLFGMYDMCTSYVCSLDFFPEIEAQKPKNAEWLWWEANCNGGIKYRIAAIKKCIDETHPDNPKNKRK